METTRARRHRAAAARRRPLRPKEDMPVARRYESQLLSAANPSLIVFSRDGSTENLT
jgi:hypothetical protein